MGTRPVIILDPGHGGSAAAGGSSPNHARGPNGLLEKNLALDLAQRVARELGDSADVQLTRTDDRNLSLRDRALLSRSRGAHCFLSLHLNGSHDLEMDGTEVWVARNADARTRALAASLSRQVAEAAGVPDRSFKLRNLGVLLPSRQAPHSVACLLEVAYLSHPRTARQFESEEHRRRIAAAIAATLKAALLPSAATALSESETVHSLGDPPAWDRLSAFPRQVRDFWAARNARMHHHVWHLARSLWDRLTASQRADVRALGFSEPPRLAGADSRPADAGAGLDFLFMHREMVKATHDLATRHRLPYRPTGWSPIPWNHSDRFWPMPVWSTSPPFKAQETTDYWHERCRNVLENSRWLAGVSLDALGTEIEEGIHNWFHMHWSTDRSADLTDVTPANDWLGHPFSAAVNPAFWKLHGWIDATIARWERANTAARTGQSIATAIRGFTPWLGPVPTAPAARSKALLAAEPSRHPEFTDHEAWERVRQIPFEPFPFAWLTIAQLRERFGPEREAPLLARRGDAEQPARSAGISLSAPSLDRVVEKLDELQGTSFGTFDEYKKSLKDDTVFGRSVKGVHPDFLAKLKKGERRAEELQSAANGSGRFDVAGIGGFRSSAGWHGWGLAVDINYDACPYIMHEAGESRLDRELAPAYHRIARLLLGRDSVIPVEITKGTPSLDRTKRLCAMLKQEHQAMKRCFGFLGDPSSAEPFLRAAGSASPDWNHFWGNSAAPSRDDFLRVLMQDYVILAGRAGPAVSGLSYPKPTTVRRDDGKADADRPFAGDPRRRGPEFGFLNVPDEIILALSEQGLRWGAIDFGRESGDVMHFDDGRGSLAAKIAKAKKAAAA